MDLLCIEHQDFTLQIDCDRFQRIWDKASRNVKEENLYSTYEWSGEVESVQCNEMMLENGRQGKAIFFDNTDYPIWVDFKNEVKKASFNSPLRKVADNFRFHEKRQVLSGYLNYGNEVGHSEIVLNYTLKDGESKRFSFKFDVLSTKLNYHEHWREIIKDIEKEYRMLSIDFLKKTFHSFDVSNNEEKTHDLIWWQLFKPLREEFVISCKAILDRPRHRLKNSVIYQRADRIRRFTPLMENEYARHKKEAGHLYRTEVAQLNNDTLENRFLKFAVKLISEKHADLGRMILQQSGISEERASEIKDAIQELDSLNYHPFFRTVSAFKGLSQESMVLQKDTNYSNVYRIWLILLQSYSLNEGLHNLETKDIATLYEIWCYIQMKEIVRQQLGEGIEVDNSSRIELNGAFRFELGKGDKSRIIFKKGEVELAELIYNPTQGDNDRRDINIDNLISMTVPQKPDIVLRLTKSENDHGMKLTYLFDAKYRIDGKDNNGVDCPPEDAINQMHRYRDAIYYTENNGQGLKKEVIGGYILFPGNGDSAKTQVARFFQSIEDVNIGAFPLRPKDKENRKLLDDFVKKLLSARAKTLLTQGNVIPQKGLKYEHDENVVGKDATCLVCYTSSEKIERAKKAYLYYVRTGDRPGAVKFDIHAASVSKVILLPLTQKDNDAYVFDVLGEGASIHKGAFLKKEGFPIIEDNLQDPYLVYHLENDYMRKKFPHLDDNPFVPKQSKVDGSPFIIKMSELENKG